MDEEIRKKIEKYRRLPAFLQRRAYYGIISSIPSDDFGKDRDCLLELVKNSKKRIRYQVYTTCSAGYYYSFDEGLFNHLDDESQKIILGKMNYLDIMGIYQYIKDIEYAQRFLNEVLQEAKELDKGKTPKDEGIDKKTVLTILSSCIKSSEEREETKQFIENHVQELYELYKDHPIHEWEGRKNDSTYAFIMGSIFKYLTDEQKKEVFPRINKEYTEGQGKYFIRSFCEKIYYYLPDTEQQKYFDGIMDQMLKDECKTNVDYNLLFLVHYSHSKVQEMNIQRVIEYGKKNNFEGFEGIWSHFDKRVQRHYYRQIMTDELRESHKYAYFEIYRHTAGKLQSEILNESMFKSFNESSEKPTMDFSRYLEYSSKEVYERNFEYFFRNMKDKSGYRREFLRYCEKNDGLKGHFDTIKEFYVKNFEALLKEGDFYEIIGASKYLDSNGCLELFKVLNNYSKNNPEVEDRYGNIHSVKLGLKSFFDNISGDKQLEIFDAAFEDKDDDLISTLFSGLKINTLQKQREIVEKYLKIKGCDEEKIKKTLDLYSKLFEKNNLIAGTVNLEFLSSDLVEKYDFSQLLQLTNYDEVQRALVQQKDNKGFIGSFSKLLDSPENWTILADKIIKNIGKDEYSDLLGSIKDKELSETESNNLNLILSQKNYFEIKTYEDLQNFDKSNGKKDVICEKIFSGEVDGLPDEIMQMSPEERKRFAISQYIFGTVFDGKFDEIFAEGVQSMKEIDGNPEFNKRLAKIKKILVTHSQIKKADEKELDEIIEYIRDNKTNVERYNIIEVESEVINLFRDSINNSLYKPKNHPEDLVGKEIHEENGQKKEVEVYRIHDNFDLIVRVEGAYSQFMVPEDFRDYFNQPNIKYHGNCSSIIGSDLIAPAREKDTSIMVGYETISKNGLLLLAPYDLSSGGALQTISPYNTGAYRPSKFFDIEETKNRTRHTHNEIALERVIVTSNGEVEKLVPSQIMWIEEEMTEEFPPPKVTVEIGEEAEEEKKQMAKRWTKWENTKKAASDLGIPIVVVNREYFAKRETQKLEQYQEMILGNESIPENESRASIMTRALITMENNSNSLRFSQKIKDKYFTQENRECINDVIMSQIDKLMITNPEEALECVRAVSKRYEYEKNESESSEIITYYSEKYAAIQEKEEELKKYLGIESEIQLEMSPSSKDHFQKVVEEINQTDYYTNQKAHSIEHIEKVMLFSQILAQNEGMSEKDTRLLLAAGAFHDSSRNGEDGNVEHAREGATTAREYFENHPGNPYGVKQEDIPILQVAIAYHEYNEPIQGKVDRDKLAELCREYGVSEEDYSRTEKIAELLKDADALDRERFANKAKLNPKMLRSKTARSYEMRGFAARINDKYAQKVLKLNYGEEGRTGKSVAELRYKRQEREGSNGKEKKVSLAEMFELFEDMTKGRTNNKKRTERDVHRCLLINYGESGITGEDVAIAENILARDASRGQQPKSKDMIQE